MIKKKHQLRFGQDLYIVENIDKGNYLLRNLNTDDIDWVSKETIAKSLKKLTFNQSLNEYSCQNDGVSISLLENGDRTTIDVNDGTNHYYKSYRNGKTKVMEQFTKKFNYFNEITPQKLLENGFTTSLKQPLLESFGGQIFYHGSHTKNIQEFSGNVFWSTTLDFAEQYGPIIYKAQLDLGKCFNISIKQHFNWLLKQVGGKIVYKDENEEECYLFDFNDYCKICHNNWETVEQYLDIIKGSFNSCQIVEENIVNYIVFNNNQIRIIDVFNRQLDESISYQTGHPVKLIGYHGTKADFETFDKEFAKNGFYFCSKKRLYSIAGYYAQNNGYIIKAELTLNNPYVCHPNDKLLDKKYDKIIAKGYDGIISVSDENRQSPFYNYTTQMLDNEKVDVNDVIEIIVFEPSQIKILGKYKPEEIDESIITEDYKKDKEYRTLAKKLTDIIFKKINSKDEMMNTDTELMYDITDEFYKASDFIKDSGKIYSIAFSQSSNDGMASFSASKDESVCYISFPILPKPNKELMIDLFKRNKKAYAEFYDKWSVAPKDEQPNIVHEAFINLAKKYVKRKMKTEFADREDVIVHECIHLLDYLRRTKGYVPSRQNVHTEKGLKDYYNSAEEQNAYYQETVHNFDHWINQDRAGIVTLLFDTKDFREFFKAFVQQYQGDYSKLNKENKVKIAKRAYQYWLNAFEINSDKSLKNRKTLGESSWYGNVNWQNNMNALGNVPATIGHNLFATMYPFHFLKLCPKYSYGDDEWFDKQIEERKPYGIPFLKVDVDQDKKQLIVTNHEGRHRVASVQRKEPNVDIPVAILYNKDRYTLPDINTLRKEWSIVSQDGNTEFNVGQFSLYKELPKESGLSLYNIYKDKKITETKNDNIEFYDSVKDIHKEAVYKTLQLIDNDKIIGYVDYIVYDDEPSIEYIYVDPQYRRNRYGTKLIQKIQALYPNSEINFGMMTDDGTNLYQSLDKTIIRNDEYNKKVEQLSKINHWLDNYGKIMNKDMNDWTDDEETYLRKYADIWGKYNNKKKDIETWLENNKETQVFINY